MRCQANQAKGNQIFVINDELYNILSSKTEDKYDCLATKLSLLFHWPTTSNPLEGHDSITAISLN